MAFTFGNPTGTAPAFGAAPAASSSFGFGTSSTATPFGGFGTTATAPTAATSFSFGTPAASAAAPAFGGFSGQQTMTAPGSTGFGFGLPTSSSAATGFGSFGTPASSSAFGGFGGATASTGFAGFGSGTAGFGSTGTLGNPFGSGTSQSQPFSFGLQTTQSSSLFPSVAAGQSAFGSSFGQQQQQQLQLAAANQSSSFYNAFSCSLFGDERDNLLAKFNALQARWGTGKGFFSRTAPPICFTPNNPLCKFKAIVYNKMPTSTDEDGLVTLMVNKKDLDSTSQQQLSSGLHTIFGSKPQVQVSVNGVKPLGNDRCSVDICVIEQTSIGSTRKVPASEVVNYLNQPMPKSQLTSQGIDRVVPNVALSKEQIKEYLENPPEGIDPALWSQAQHDNIDEQSFLPVPVFGFVGLRQRIQMQDEETKRHQARFAVISNEMMDLKKRQETTKSLITKYKCKGLELAHRLMKVIGMLESNRKFAVMIQADEERLRGRIEAIQAQLVAPKGKLNELLCQMRLQKQQSMSINQKIIDERVVDLSAVEDIKQVLKSQQDCITEMVSVIKSDISDLNTIKNGLREQIQKQHGVSS